MKKDLTGQRFGNLLVLEESEKRHGRTAWLCLCDCGEKSNPTTTNLVRGNSTKCSSKCKLIERYNFVDLTGLTFNKFKVLKKLEEKTKTRGSLWLCECECGNLKKLSSNALTSGNNTSCGCNRYKIEVVKNIPLFFLNAIKQNAIKRNLIFNVSYDYLESIFTGFCALSGLKIDFAKNGYQKNKLYSTASLDRIDSNKGYIEGNVQWVNKDVNKMKSNKTDAEFINMCKIIAEFNK